MISPWSQKGEGTSGREKSKDTRRRELEPLPTKKIDSSSANKPQSQPFPDPEATSQQNLILNGNEGLAADCVLLIMFK